MGQGACCAGAKGRKAGWAGNAAWQLGQEEEKGPKRGSVAQEGKNGFPFMIQGILRWNSKEIEDEFERDSRGSCYGFMHSKLQTRLKLKTNLRAQALSYNQFYMNATIY
jgi:hypothetical protein